MIECKAYYEHIQDDGSNPSISTILHFLTLKFLIMRIQNRNKDIKQAMTVGLILVSTPFTISIVTKLFAVLVGFLFGWHNHDILLGTVPVWIFITILMLFIHIYLLAAYDEDCKRVDKQRADYNA